MNPYHKPAGTYKPIIDNNLQKMTPAERFGLMFQKYDELQDQRIQSLSQDGCMENEIPSLQDSSRENV